MLHHCSENFLGSLNALKITGHTSVFCVEALFTASLDELGSGQRLQADLAFVLSNAPTIADLYLA